MRHERRAHKETDRGEEREGMRRGQNKSGEGGFYNEQKFIGWHLHSRKRSV